MTNKKHISNHLYAYNVTRATYSPHVKPCAHVDHFAHHTHLVPPICTDYLPHTTLFITIDGHCLLFGLAYTTFLCICLDQSLAGFACCTGDSHLMAGDALAPSQPRDMQL